MNPLRFPAPGLCALLTLSCGLCPAPSAVGAKPIRTIESAASPARDHHLFVGIDLYYPHGPDLCPVQKFDGDDSVLRLESGEHVVARQANGFQWKMQPKVSPLAIQIERLKPERTYSGSNDPIMKRMVQQMALSSYHDDQATRADRALARAYDAAAAADRQAATSGAPPLGQSADSMRQQATNAHIQAHAAISALSDPSLQALPELDDASRYDAIRLRFIASSPVAIAEANALAMVRIRTETEGYRDLSFQRPIGSLGPRPRLIEIDQAGFPQGYELVTAQLHIFNQTEEIATNLSERHMPLTAAEAREYLLLDYHAQHSGSTVPARPAWSLAPAALRAIADPALVDFTVEAAVDAEGRLTALRPGEGQILPDHIRELLEQLTYLPALDEGVPVAATTTVNLADYFR